MSITILIADDEKSVCKMLRIVLKGCGDVAFLEAKDAVEALKIAREHRGHIDLLISDVVMPGRMNGIEMAAQLSQARPEMKVVLMSGYAPDAGTIEPAWRFIKKPFAASEIRENIRSILDRQSVAA